MSQELSTLPLVEEPATVIPLTSVMRPLPDAAAELDHAARQAGLSEERSDLLRVALQEGLGHFLLQAFLEAYRLDGSGPGKAESHWENIDQSKLDELSTASRQLAERLVDFRFDRLEGVSKAGQEGASLEHEVPLKIPEYSLEYLRKIAALVGLSVANGAPDEGNTLKFRKLSGGPLSHTAGEEATPRLDDAPDILAKKRRQRLLGALALLTSSYLEVPDHSPQLDRMDEVAGRMLACLKDPNSVSSSRRRFSFNALHGEVARVDERIGSFIALLQTEGLDIQVHRQALGRDTPPPPKGFWSKLWRWLAPPDEGSRKDDHVDYSFSFAAVADGGDGEAVSLPKDDASEVSPALLGAFSAQLRDRASEQAGQEAQRDRLLLHVLTPLARAHVSGDDAPYDADNFARELLQKLTVYFRAASDSEPPEQVFAFRCPTGSASENARQGFEFLRQVFEAMRIHTSLEQREKGGKILFSFSVGGTAPAEHH